MPGQTYEWFPVLPVKLRYGTRTTDWFAAFVDSGSHCCLFHNDFAKTLGLDLRQGDLDRVRGLQDESWVEVRYLDVTLIVAGEALVVPVGFCDLAPWPGLLGRSGFFEKFIVTFDHSGNPPGMDVERIGP